MALRRRNQNYFVLCIDLEKCTFLKELGKDISEEEQYEISRRGIEKVMSFFKKVNIKATFFVGEDMASLYPTLVKHLWEQGHEIALHYEVSPKSENEIKIFKERLEDITGEQVIGFRTHRFETFPIDRLLALGFLYNNSTHPTFVPGRYCNIFESAEIDKKEGVWNIPVSVTPFLRLPFSWIWFRNFGVNYAKLCSQSIFNVRNIVNIYFHPWDFEDLSKYNIKKYLFLSIRNSGDKCFKHLENYIEWLKIKKVVSVSFKNYLVQNKYL